LIVDDDDAFATAVATACGAVIVIVAAAVAKSDSSAIDVTVPTVGPVEVDDGMVDVVVAVVLSSPVAVALAVVSPVFVVVAVASAILVETAIEVAESIPVAVADAFAAPSTVPSVTAIAVECAIVVSEVEVAVASAANGPIAVDNAVDDLKALLFAVAVEAAVSSDTEYAIADSVPVAVVVAATVGPLYTVASAHAVAVSVPVAVAVPTKVPDDIDTAFELIAVFAVVVDVLEFDAHALAYGVVWVADMPAVPYTIRSHVVQANKQDPGIAGNAAPLGPVLGTAL
jgi:hypothetical protein